MSGDYKNDSLVPLNNIETVPPEGTIVDQKSAPSSAHEGVVLSRKGSQRKSDPLRPNPELVKFSPLTKFTIMSYHLVYCYTKSARKESWRATRESAVNKISEFGSDKGDHLIRDEFSTKIWKKAPSIIFGVIAIISFVMSIISFR